MPRAALATCPPRQRLEFLAFPTTTSGSSVEVVRQGGGAPFEHESRHNLHITLVMVWLIRTFTSV